LLLARLRGARRPDRREWANAAITGVLLLAVGNGGVTWAEQTVPSGLAALVASAVPIWMALIDWARPGGARPSLTTPAGLLLGATGLVILFGGDLTSTISTVGDSRLTVVVLLLATIGWALGSVMASHV